jgi:aspartyl-tRNA(Asn)/glutamyl-tRNA(Gln) amidotransferase subunit B
MTFDAAKGEVRPIRAKEESHDYRYFPEPDLPPLVLKAEWLAAERQSLPELPAARRERLQRQLGLSPAEAAVVTTSAAVADHVEALATLLGDGAGKEAWNWVANDVLAHSEDGGTIPARLTPARIADMVGLVRGATVSRQAAKKVLAEMLTSDEPATAIAQRLGLVQVQDAGTIEQWVREVIDASPAEVARYRGGETKLLGYLTGQVMKQSKGKADPKAVHAALAAAIGPNP